MGFSFRRDQLPETSPPTLPLLENFVHGGIRLGANILVEYEAHSPWYETSLSLARDSLKRRIKTEYHTFQHLPDEVREDLGRLGLRVRELEEAGILRVVDSYTITTGIPLPEKGEGGWEPFQSNSTELSVWSKVCVNQMKQGFHQSEKNWLHIDDNTSVLLQYNSEKEFIDFWRITFIPWARARGLTMIHSLVTGAADEAFYRKFEAICDGILDFKSEERAGEIRHFARVRMMRSRRFDSHWKAISISEDGGVRISEPATVEGFKFKVSRSSKVFDYLVSAFVDDHMVRKMQTEKSGWRSLVELSNDTRIPRSVIYGRTGGLGAPVDELVRRGLAEVRIFTGERGRGGKIMRVRVAHEREPVREYITETIKSIST